MELEIYDALTSANVPPDKARAAASSVRKEIDSRYALHAAQLSTRGDVESVRREIAELKAEMVKWFVASSIAIVGMTAGLIRLMQ